MFAGNALTEGATMAIDFLKESAIVAAQDQAAQVRLEQTLHDVTGATKAQAEAIGEQLTAMSEATGVAKGDMFTAYQQLVVATHSTTKAHKDLQLALDVSAGTGRSLTTVSLALAKAQNGNVGGLSRLGIATKDAHGHTMKLNEIMGKLATTYKGQAEAHANSLAGQTGRLKVTFEEFEARVGQKVIPILTELASIFINRVIPAIQQAIQWVQANLGPKIEQAFAVLKQVVSDALTAIEDFWHAFGGRIMSYLKTGLGNWIQQFKGVFQVVEGLFQIFDAIITGKWSKLWTGLGNVFKGFANIFSGMVKQLWNVVTLVFQVAATIIGNVLKGLWDLILRGWTVQINFFRGIGSKIASAASGMWNGISAPFKTMINTIIGWWNDFVGHLRIPGVSIGPVHFGGWSPGNSLKIAPLAQGGIVMPRPGGTLAQLAEAGHPEAVIPLDGKHSFGGGTTINIYAQTLPGNESATAREIQRLLVKRARETGNLQLAAAFGG